MHASVQRQTLSLAVMLAASLAASAQQTVPQEFPPEATPLSAEALKSRLAGKTFAVKLANGGNWRLDYRSNGFFFLNHDEGNTSGSWRTEESRLCTETRRTPLSCNEVRERGDTLYLKRDSGEVVAFMAK